MTESLLDRSRRLGLSDKGFVVTALTGWIAMLELTGATDESIQLARLARDVVAESC